MEIRIFKIVIYLSLIFSTNTVSSDVSYRYVSEWLQAPRSDGNVGGAHGDIQFSSSGTVFLSTDEGLLKFQENGQYVSNIANKLFDIHGFVIHRDTDGKEYIYAARVIDQSVVKMTLDGEIVLTISRDSVPITYRKKLSIFKRSILSLIIWWKYGKFIGFSDPAAFFTAVDVADDGTIFAVDGYGLDYIHKFSSEGDYISSFGGSVNPWKFNNCHKIAIDRRFIPNRLVCVDRGNNRIVQMTLGGDVVEVIDRNLKSPSSVSFFENYMAVAEIEGRVSVLDIDSKPVAILGENPDSDLVYKESIPPSKWRPGIFTSPHGIDFDSNGNIVVSEWNEWGRVLRYEYRR